MFRYLYKRNGKKKRKDKIIYSNQNISYDKRKRKKNTLQHMTTKEIHMSERKI